MEELLKDKRSGGVKIMPKYVVLQMTLTEKLFSANPKSKNLTELERMINAQAEKGYRLHTMIPAAENENLKKTQVIMVFEKM